MAARPSFSNKELGLSSDIFSGDGSISLISANFSFLNFVLICWNIFWYWFITWFLVFYLYLLQALWIFPIFLVSSSKDIWFVSRMVLIKSGCPFSLWSAKTGTSSCIHLMILISMLLMYSFKFLEWEEEFPFLSLVIGWLPPNSDASILIFSNFETTLSFLMKVEWDWVLFFLGWITWEMVCYPTSNAIFFQLGIVQEVTCPDLILCVLVWLRFFLVDCDGLPIGACILLWCFWVVLSFLKADKISF